MAALDHRWGYYVTEQGACGLQSVAESKPAAG
jgi:hypothetical protein